MSSNSRNKLIVAGTAVLLVLIIMLFISFNPWMLVGISAVLFAVAAIVRAVNGTPDDDDRSEPDPPAGDHDDPGDQVDRGVPV